MNGVTERIFEQFQINGQAPRPQTKFGQDNKGFGWDTVLHAAKSLRMPYRPHLDAPFDVGTVVDQDLRVAGTEHIYVAIAGPAVAVPIARTHLPHAVIPYWMGPVRCCLTRPAQAAIAFTP